MNNTSNSNRDSLEKLCGYIDERKKDRKFIDDGGFIFYAIDTNIIKSYANASSRNVSSYKLFKESDIKIAEKLAMCLSSYILFDFTKIHPLLMFDAHLREMDELYSAVVQRYHFRKEGVHKYLEELLVSTKTKELKKVDFNKLANELNGITHLGGELERIDCLLGKDRNNSKFCGALYLLKKHPDIAKKFSLPLLRIKNDDESFNIIEKHVEDKLKEFAPKREKRNRLKDFSVLSDLLYINKELLKSEIKARLILISTDQQIKKAAEILNAVPQKNGKEEHADSETAPIIHIRHPFSFLGDEGFIGEMDYAAKQLLLKLTDNNLNKNSHTEVHIKTQIKEFDNLSSYLEELLVERNKGMQQSEHELNYLPKLFDDFLSHKLSHYSFKYPDRIFKPKISKLIEKIEHTPAGEEGLRDLYNQANDLLIKDTSLFFFHMYKKELKSFIKSDKKHFRMPPLIQTNFEEDANEYAIEDNYIPLYLADHSKDSKFEERKEKSSKYTNYEVAFYNAVNWAYLDRWNYVQENSGRAFKIAIDLLDNRKHHDSDGSLFAIAREAGYLNAVATRHLIELTEKKEFTTTVKSLKADFNYLKNTLQKYERIENQKKDTLRHRFQLEELFIDWMEFWYEVFCSELERKPTNEIKNLITELIDFKKRFKKIADEIDNEIKNLEDLTENRLRYLIYILRHAAMGYCMISIALHKHEVLNLLIKNNEEELKHVVTLYIETEEKFGEHRFKDNSLFFSSTMLISKFLYSELEKKQKSKIKNLLITELLTDKNIKRYSKKPYEKSRYEFFLKILNEAP